MTSSASKSKLPPLYSELAVDPDFGEIVEMFVDEMPQRLETLRQHFESGDREKLRGAAHQIKGAGGSYGFDEITPFAARLESVANNHALEDEILAALNDLIATCSRIRAGVPEEG